MKSDMGKLQTDALAAYDKIKADRGEVTYLDAFVAGAEWQKEDLMKDAIEGEVTIWNNSITLGRRLGPAFNKGDRVKVIVTKE